MNKLKVMVSSTRMMVNKPTNEKNQNKGKEDK